MCVNRNCIWRDFQRTQRTICTPKQAPTRVFHTYFDWTLLPHGHLWRPTAHWQCNTSQPKCNVIAWNKMQSRPTPFEHSLRIEQKKNIVNYWICYIDAMLWTRWLVKSPYKINGSNDDAVSANGKSKKKKNKLDCNLRFSPMIFGTNRKIFSFSATSLAIFAQLNFVCCFCLNTLMLSFTRIDFIYFYLGKRFFLFFYNEVRMEFIYTAVLLPLYR